MSRASGRSRRTSRLSRTSSGNGLESTEPRSVLEVSADAETWCDMNVCRMCIVAITARIGFAPSEIRLHENLRRKHCARKLTMQHEQAHAAVTRRAQAIAVEEARRTLAWARSRYPAHVSPVSAGRSRTAGGHAQGRTGT